jgi:PAS domain S-box-containing protein
METLNLRQPDFRALFDAIPGAYLVLLPDDPIYTIVCANSAYVQATLVDPKEIVGRGLFEVFPNNSEDPQASGVQNLQDSLRQVIATKAPHAMPAQKFDIRRLRGCGVSEERYWSRINTPMLSSDGTVEFLLHRLEDVTDLAGLPRLEAEQGKPPSEFGIRAAAMNAELFLSARQLDESKRLARERQKVEEKLLAVDARFSLAFAKAPIGMVLLTPDGRITEVNQAFVDMLGYAKEEFASRDSSLFTHPEDVALTTAFFESLRRGPSDAASIEKRYFRKDREILWTRASAAMRRDEIGRPAEVIAIVEDITERKRAEERLRESEQRFRFLAESIPQMVWTAAPDGGLDYVNGQGSKYFGTPQEALLGGGWLEGVHPAERERTLSLWNQFIATAAPYEIAFRLKRGSDGNWRWHLARALPLIGEDGKVLQWFGTCTDIDDQRQAAANLHQQWQIFDTTLSHTPDFTYTFDLSGRFTYVNRALLSLWQKSLEEARGRTFFELGYPAALAGRLQLQIQQVIETRQPVRDQTPFTGPSGDTRYYDYILVPVLDTEGKAKAVAGSTRDITEQNRVAQQIEDDRRRWRELLVQTPAAIAVLRGPEHRFEWVNPDYERLVGRPGPALIGKMVQEALPEIGDQVYVGLLDQVYRTGEPFTGRDALARLNRGDGTLKDFYLNFVYLPTRNETGEIDGIFVHVTDVTDTVVGRKKIEESERQFRTLAETIPHLAWMADESGYISWYNRRWFEYTGTTLDEVGGWGWQKLHDPAVLPEVISGWQKALTSGDPFEMIFPLRRADGEFRSFLTRVEPVKNAEGRIVRWFGTNTDITEQRRTEEELRRMNRELEEFAYVASHDLQEPLRMVNIYTQMILKKTREGSTQELGQYSGFVQEGVKRMEVLIRDLLTFSRTIHAEALPIGTADLSAALREAMSVLKGRIEEAGAVVTMSALPCTRGETSQIAHVFQNVLSNALKYRKREVPPEVRISAKREDEQWVISISDNGIGFDQQYAKRIFGLFKRLHKEEYPGTGLGLAICQRIIERYGGRMWAVAQIGEGATFYISLPRVAEP